LSYIVRQLHKTSSSSYYYYYYYPAARVGHYARTISTSTQNASIWSLTAAAPSNSVFYALCTHSLTYRDITVL